MIFVMLFYSYYQVYLQVQRQVYDPKRGLSIKTKNPLKARDVNAKVPKPHLDLDGLALGARLVDGKSLRIQDMTLKNLAEASAVVDLVVEQEEVTDAVDAVKSPPKKAAKNSSRAASTPAPQWTSELKRRLSGNLC